MMISFMDGPLDSVHILAIQCDVLSSVAKSHKKFLQWCQEPLLTGILWHLLESSHSQVAQVAVPLLMHSVGLPGGSDVLWKSLDEDFHSEDWRVRMINFNPLEIGLGSVILLDIVIEREVSLLSRAPSRE